MKYNIFNAMKWVGLVGYAYNVIEILRLHLMSSVGLLDAMFNFVIPIITFIFNPYCWLFFFMSIVGLIFTTIYKPKGVNISKVAKG